jgi:glucose/arabinose dehydrogenase
MARITALALTMVVAGCTVVGAATSPDDTQLVDIGAGLSGPAGVTAAVYATGLANVAGLTLDAEGRLWAATAGYSDGGDDALYVIEAANRTPLKVVDGLRTPLGLLWIDDTLYVSSESGVDAYSGFDGTRFADTKEVFDLPDGAGEANGLALSPDGRIVLGISAPCDHCTPTDAYSASVVSFLPDGSDVEVVASGVRAPIGLAYVPGSSDLLVTMNQRDDLGDATPGDWLALVESGQDWGFPDCFGQGGAACDGVPAPIAVLDRHAAVSGIAVVEGGLAGVTTTSAYAAEWTLGKVVRVELTKGDAGYSGAVTTFLTGFRNPVPVIATEEGNLLVGDWGTGTVYSISE